MKENKTGWGGRRKGSGAKRTLPPGARSRSINMTDEELLKVKKVLNESRRNKMFKLYGMKDVKKGILFNIEGSPNGVIAVATALKPGLNERVELVDDRFRTRFKVYVSTEPPANYPVKKSMIGETVLIGSGNDLNDLKEIETYGLVRISIYKTSDKIHVQVEELDMGDITVNGEGTDWTVEENNGEGTDWTVEENNGRFKGLDDYAEYFVKSIKNAKSAKRNGNEIFVIKYYEDIDDYAEVKYKLSVTKDLVGAIGCSTRSIKRSEL